MHQMLDIDLTKCNGCGWCASVCGCGALNFVGGRIEIVETEVCDWCIQCELVCPTGALTCRFEIIVDNP